MTATTLRNRWLTTFRHMQAAVQVPQHTLPLSRPAIWKRLVSAGWIVYRATNVRRGRGIPGMAFDAMVVAAFLVLRTANVVF